MIKQQFIDAVQAAINAPSRSGTKWDPLEKLFADESLRGNGAINNGGGADRTTRVRQLATSKLHNGHTTREIASHSVFVIGGDTISTYQRDPAQYEEQVFQALQAEHPACDSCLIMVAPPNQDVRPVRLVRRSDQPAMIPYETWWPGLRTLILPAMNSHTVTNASVPLHSGLEKIGELVGKFQHDAEDSFIAVEQVVAQRFASCLLSKRFLIATGLSGSGKTILAQAFARWINPSRLALDVFAPGSEIKSANVTYYVKHSDTLSVEFWNAANEAEAIKVTLPREMIAEWAAFIEANSISPTTQAREIRDAVKGTSKFSDQLHSFETHLKAAAFALVNSQLQDAAGQCHAIVPVGADWTGNENILGYPDGLLATSYVAKPALDLILHAADHGDVPHFLVLDEMNLSHVERYFADILSIIESNEGLDLYSGDMTKPETWRKTSAAKAVPPKLKQLPANLFIIGTVNVDETTYMFSPKVLDRANVIEFRMDAGELEGFLGNPAKPDLSKLDGKGASFGKAFVYAAMSPVTVPADVKAAYDAEMLLLFKTLQAHGAEFGYRTAYETARFIHFYKLLGNHADGDTTWFPRAFDCVVFQKLLPKLHGSRAKLGPVLKKLWFLCVNDTAGRGANALQAAEDAARSTDKKNEPSVVVPTGAPYPLSAEKIGRMWRLLIENGFASFAEA